MKRTILLPSIITILFMLSCALINRDKRVEDETKLQFSIDSIFQLAQRKYLNSSTKLTLSKGFPRNALVNGEWRQVPADDWTSGFYPGTLWYIFEYTDAWRIKDQARRWTEALDSIKFMDDHHDIGFMMFSSYGNGSRLLNKPNYKKVLLQSASTLTTRFNQKTGTIRSWDWKPEDHPTIIDNMMNLELLMWAFSYSGDSLFYKIATSHADTTMKYHFRDDGSAYHLVNYNPYNGGVNYKKTKQGFSDESMWARGQAWAMYGYTFMYEYTNKKSYYDMAVKASKRFIERLPKDMVPYWDFDAPNTPNEPRDASAAAIASSSLLSLFQMSKDSAYYHSAVSILNELSSDWYLNGDLSFGGLIMHSTGSKPGNSEVDTHLNYADYYYLEALLKLSKLLKHKDARNGITLNKKAAGYQGHWYGIKDAENGYKYSGGLGTYSVKHRPFLIYNKDADRTFFTYGASLNDNYTNLFHNVGMYDHKTNKVSRPTVVLSKQTTDGHDNPVIAQDKDGYIWLFSTSHGRERASYIHRSKNPNQIDSFELIEATTEWGGVKKPFRNFSYAQVSYNNGKFMMFLTKYSFPAIRTIGYQTSLNGVDWSEFRTIASIGEGHYQITVSADDKHATAFNYHPTFGGKGINKRTNLYYLETKDGGKTWQNVKGEKVELPIEDVANPALVQEYESKGRNVYLKDISFDGEKNPAILYLVSKGAHSEPKDGPFEWHLAYWRNNTWQISKVFESDHNYDVGSVYVGQDVWKIIAPSAPGKVPHTVGGEIEMWESTDKGKTWVKKRKMTQNSERNHSYVRKAIEYHPSFAAFWADGDPQKPSVSRLYLSDESGNPRILPIEMKDDFEAPGSLVGLPK